MAPFLLIHLAAIAHAQHHQKRPAPPPMALIPKPAPLPDINSPAFQRQLAAEQRAALARAVRTHRNVTRNFAVGWEMHYGLFLVPAEAKDWLAADWSMPDFLDDALRDRVATAANGPDLGAHVRQRLICRCTGIAWRFYGERRFLIRSAELTWQ